MSQKTVFAKRLITQAQAFSEVMRDVSSLVDAYFDSGYNVGGASPMVDGDLTATYPGLTAAQVAAVIVAFQQLQNFMKGTAVVTGTYHTTFNQVDNIQPL